MLKLIGAGLIIISASLWGILKADKLKKRVILISGIISGFVFLENEIAYGKRDIKNTLLTIADAEKIDLFKNAAEYIDKLGIREGFIKAVEETGELFLGTEKQALDALAEHLGMTDTKTQISSIRHTRLLLEAAKENAAKEYDKSGKMYKSAGVLVGLAVVIFLF